MTNPSPTAAALEAVPGPVAFAIIAFLLLAAGLVVAGWVTYRRINRLGGRMNTAETKIIALNGAVHQQEEMQGLLTLNGKLTKRTGSK